MWLPAWDGKAGSHNFATFKWSRDNGAVAAAWIEGNDGDRLTVSGTRDQARGFQPKQWVEVTGDDLEFRGQPGRLALILKVDYDVITLDRSVSRNELGAHPKVRRWDQTAPEKMQLEDGAIPILEGNNRWVALEDGIEVQFPAPLKKSAVNQYQTGDHWFFPARTVTGEIEFPDEDIETDVAESATKEPKSLVPQGVNHYFAPLALVGVDQGKPKTILHDLRRVCAAQAKLVKQKLLP